MGVHLLVVGRFRRRGLRMGMRCSQTLVAGTRRRPCTSDRFRVTAISWAGRVAALIDGLVDRAHRRWPDGCGVVHLPATESVFLPAHRPDDPPCGAGHVGYYRTRIGPNCAANPIPRQRGGSGLQPLVLEMTPPWVRGVWVSGDWSIWPARPCRRR